MDYQEKASGYFEQGYNCAQSVFAAFAEKNGMDAEAALLTASAFGGGMGRMQQTCGAVTGALMALGLEKGYTHPDQQEEKDTAYLQARELMERFREEFGALDCSELLGHSLLTEEGRMMIKDKHLSELVCARCVRVAAGIVEDLIIK